jgi:hypothetical protein
VPLKFAQHLPPVVGFLVQAYLAFPFLSQSQIVEVLFLRIFAALLMLGYWVPSMIKGPLILFRPATRLGGTSIGLNHVPKGRPPSDE